MKIGNFWKSPLLIVGLLFLGLSIIIVAGLVATFNKSGETRYMERYVIVSLSPTMVHVKTLALFQPTLGDGYCWVAYEMKPEDFNAILRKGKKPWHPGLIQMMDSNHELGVDQKKYFGEVWPNNVGPVETYYCGGQAQEGILGTAEMVVSQDHTRALFFISDL